MFQCFTVDERITPSTLLSWKFKSVAKAPLRRSVRPRQEKQQEKRQGSEAQRRTVGHVTCRNFFGHVATPSARKLLLRAQTVTHPPCVSVRRPLIVHILAFVIDSFFSSLSGRVSVAVMFIEYCAQLCWIIYGVGFSISPRPLWGFNLFGATARAATPTDSRRRCTCYHGRSAILMGSFRNIVAVFFPMGISPNDYELSWYLWATS